MNLFNSIFNYKKNEIEKIDPKSDSGLLFALCGSTGIQDKNNNKSLFNFKSRILTGIYSNAYQCSYRKLNLDSLRIEEKDAIKVTYRFKKDYNDLVSNIDIAIPPDVDDNFIQSIKIYFNNKLLDSIDTKVIDVLKINSILFRRPINTIGYKKFIPLTLASIQKNNLLKYYTSDSIYLSIEIVYNPFLYKYIDQVEFYGDLYVLSTPSRNDLIYRIHEFATIQNKQMNNIIHYGTNKIELKFNLQLPLIYFWGFNTGYVINIKLLLNDRPYYDGTPETLVQEMKKRNYNFPSQLCDSSYECKDIDLTRNCPLCIFFSPSEIEEYTNSSLNSSRYNTMHLVIETTDKEDKNIYINALNLNTIIYNKKYDCNYSFKYI